MKKKHTILNLVLLFILFFLFAGCSSSKITLETINIDKVFLPVFVSPQVDIQKGGNGLTGVALDLIQNQDNKVIYQYTCIFADEDYPDFFLNFFYDIFRYFKYHRLMDTESFTITFIKTPDDIWKVEKVIFSDVFSKDQTFYKKKIVHYQESIDGSNFILKDSRIIIYINTWNHLFSNTDNNPNLQKQLFESYPVYAGSRKQVEQLFSKGK